MRLSKKFGSLFFLRQKIEPVIFYVPEDQNLCSRKKTMEYCKQAVVCYDKIELRRVPVQDADIDLHRYCS